MNIIIIIYRNLKQSPLVYARYIDNTGTIVNNVNEAKQMFQYLNEQHPTIKFELELPDQSGFLTISDIKVKINEDRSTENKFYTKKANKGITLHHNSHRPTAAKRTMIRKEMQRVIICMLHGSNQNCLLFSLTFLIFFFLCSVGWLEPLALFVYVILNLCTAYTCMCVWSWFSTACSSSTGAQYI